MFGKRLDRAVLVSALGLLLAPSCSLSERSYAGPDAEEGGAPGESGAPPEAGGADAVPSAGEGGRTSAEEDQTCERSADCESPPGSLRCFLPFCSAEGDCVYVRAEAGTPCGTPTSCSAATWTSAEVCNDAGICEAVVEDCSPFVCDEDEVQCFTACTTADQCLPHHRCDEGSCIPFVEVGDACNAHEACESGHCGCSEATCSTAGKVCLPAACDEPCRYGAGADGECEGFVAPGSDDLANSCGATACNGSGGCQFAVGTACISNDQCDGGHCECVDSTCTSRVCTVGGCGPCQFWSIAACGNIDAGLQDPDGCVGDQSCKNGSCVNRKPHGASCTINDECSDTCISNLCAPESPTGGPCDLDDQVDCINGDVCHGIGYFCSLTSTGCCQ